MSNPDLSHYSDLALLEHVRRESRSHHVHELAARTEHLLASLEAQDALRKRVHESERRIRDAERMERMVREAAVQAQDALAFVDRASHVLPAGESWDELRQTVRAARLALAVALP